MKRLTMLLAALALAACAQLRGASDWVTLIDGERGLENFDRYGDANWHAEDGAIVADSGKAGFLMSKQAFGDFEAHIEFWPAPNANSGIYMRCSDLKSITDRTCHEANIFDQRPDQTFATGGIVHLGKVLQPTKAGGKWNVYDITACPMLTSQPTSCCAGYAPLQIGGLKSYLASVNQMYAWFLEDERNAFTDSIQPDEIPTLSALISASG